MLTREKVWIYVIFGHVRDWLYSQIYFIARSHIANDILTRF